MREIKFRAWDKVEKKMKLPTLLRLSRDLPYTDDNNNGKVFQMQCNGQENVEYFNGRIELMQYTGLKDKNGKEIYEGDTIAWYKEPKRASAYIYWDDYLAMVLVKDLGDYGEIVAGMNEIEVDEVIVIGNIYENPELLQQGV
ncbi:MAG TPA: YopX family protein [Tissierellaceae bacterium]|nr:YopX family protein [Tissierellaceae bacterium]